jgi:peptide deformylase
MLSILKIKSYLKIAISLFIIILPFSCSKPITFTQTEMDIIGSDSTAGIMRLFTIDNPADTSVLRALSNDLSIEDIKSQYYTTLKKRMLATVMDTANAGVGIAAPQVGINKRVVAVQRLDKPGEPFEFYANIKFLELSSECSWGWEGCLSVPNKRDTVYRSDSVVISYLDDQTLSEKKDTIKGFTAIIFQHEVDHLDGILYIDRQKPSVK